MGLRELEASILRELRSVVGDSKLRQKHIQEWATTEMKPQDGERVVYLPDLSVFVAYKPSK